MFHEKLPCQNHCPVVVVKLNAFKIVLFNELSKISLVEQYLLCILQAESFYSKNLT